MPKTKRRLVKRLPQHVAKRSLKRDSQRKALPAGRRISKNGKKYTETRRNRSDAKGKRI